jgi:F0F1-type ATP synthase assembly protein I
MTGEEKPSMPGWAAFVTMGTTVAACVGVFTVLGILADSWLGTSPALLFVGLLLGCASAAVVVASLVRRYL